MLVLGTDECWQLFRSAEVGRLAVSISNHPDIFPLNYVVDGESIVFRTAPGTKLAAAVPARPSRSRPTATTPRPAARGASC
ncbi:MAG: pyridoxamine 5'-phosphate oxidase family protein [Ilumatobacteraceae bacterium]